MTAACNWANFFGDISNGMIRSDPPPKNNQADGTIYFRPIILSVMINVQLLNLSGDPECKSL